MVARVEVIGRKFLVSPQSFFVETSDYSSSVGTAWIKGGPDVRESVARSSVRQRGARRWPAGLSGRVM